jgi:hypothetical protein
LGWEHPDEAEFAADTRIVLLSGEFSKEITTAVLWLNERDLDIRCVRLRPYSLDGRTLLDIQQVMPLPEATEYPAEIDGLESGAVRLTQIAQGWKHLTLEGVALLDQIFKG